MKRTFNEKLYFRGDTRFGKTLRFFNLLEPGKMVLSISKIFMWMMIFAVLAILLTCPENLSSLLTAVGGSIISTGNYMYRRHMQQQEPDPEPETLPEGES